MKKILMSVFAIAVMAAVAGVGSWALWSDTETSEGNSIVAGSLDLLVDGENWDGSKRVVVKNVYPGAQDSVDGTVRNNGTIDGTLSFSVSHATNYENDLIEPEEEDGDVTSGETEGELCGKIEVRITYNGEIVSGDEENGGWVILSSPSLWSISLGELSAEDEGDYTVEYRVKTNANNTIMTDSCEFDMGLVLSQNTV